MNTFETWKRDKLKAEVEQLQSAVHELEEMVSAREADIIERNVEIERLRGELLVFHEQWQPLHEATRRYAWCCLQEAKLRSNQVNLSAHAFAVDAAHEAMRQLLMKAKSAIPPGADRASYEANKEELEAMAAEFKAAAEKPIPHPLERITMCVGDELTFHDVPAEVAAELRRRTQTNLEFYHKARREKETRIKYQDIVYRFCNLADQCIGGKSTIEDVYEIISERMKRPAQISETTKGESDGKKDNQEVSGLQGNRDSVLSDASDVLPGVQGNRHQVRGK